MIRINNIKISPSKEIRIDRKSEGLNKALLKALGKKLKIASDKIQNYKITKQSIDARKKSDVKIVFSVDVQISDETGFLKKNRDKDIVQIKGKIQNECVNDISQKKNNCNKRKIVIVGAGPAGLFCALKLAEAGMNPILLERGEDVDSRVKSVSGFWQGGRLNPNSNVQFGEGGAGTFSDGKLNTMVKDEGGRMSEVYRTFVRFGADESILYINKPHIGTDRLIEIVKGIRKKITELGGEVRFSSQMTDILIDDDSDSLEGILKKDYKNIEDNEKYPLVQSDNKTMEIKGVILSDGTIIECDTLVLALGHSARDTFEMLDGKGIAMEQKPFAMGVRVQHPRVYIDKLQYGSFHEFLPAADYKLTYSPPEGRSVYSFCMCPGGYVVNASSEPGRLAVNGMSYSGRDSAASNSALVVQIKTSDFPGEDPLAGIRLQRELEEKAFSLADGKIPVQSVGGFVQSILESLKNTENNRAVVRWFCQRLWDLSPDDDLFYENKPVCKGEWAEADLVSILPGYMLMPMVEAFPYFGKLMKGFNANNTLLLGLESRTSSPVRIMRRDDLQSINCRGLYPCGEGAGYAGGITSAAMDGIKVAEMILASNN